MLGKNLFRGDKLTMRLAYLLLSLLLFVAQGCGQSRIDGSSEESMAESIERMSEGMTESERIQFAGALITIAFSKGLETDADSAVRQVLDGKSKNEVLALAEQITRDTEEHQRLEQAVRAKRDRQLMEEEIARLRIKKAAARDAADVLAKFRIAQPHLIPPRRELFEVGNSIDFWVWNQTGRTIARVSFLAEYKTPGRAIPWVSDDFSYAIPGGLEDGERANWKLSPNMFSEIGTAEYRQDAVLSIEPVRLEGPGGSVIADGVWTIDDEERLRQLTEMLE